MAYSLSSGYATPTAQFPYFPEETLCSSNILHTLSATMIRLKFVSFLAEEQVMALLHALIIFMLMLVVGELPVTSASTDAVSAAPVSRVEVVLAYQYRTREAEIKKEFVQVGLTNVHFQYARMGQPPQNIGLGRDVPADKAREAIRLAVKYNLGVGILLPERLFPPRFITIASSNYDDTVEYHITQDTLSKLQDPALSTEAFHRLYRDLTSAVIDPKAPKTRY